jgi:hypothetical protein
VHIGIRNEGWEVLNFLQTFDDADFDMDFRNGETPFLRAIVFKNLEKVKWCVSKGAKIE